MTVGIGRSVFHINTTQGGSLLLGNLFSSKRDCQ